MELPAGVKDKYLRRISYFLEIIKSHRASTAEHSISTEQIASLQEAFIGAAGLGNTIYGTTAVQLQELRTNVDRLRRDQSGYGIMHEEIVTILQGFLTNLRHDVEEDLLNNLIDQAVNMTLGDFVLLASHALDEGEKD